MENAETPYQSGNNQSDPSRSYQSGPKRNSDTPVRRDQQNERSFDSDNNEAEINPGKLDREESSPDRDGSDNTKGHEPYEFKQNNHEGSKSSDTSKKSGQGSLMGQGGYGSEPTNSTNGSQNGSTGSKVGTYTYRPKRKEVNINELGKDAH